MFFIVGWNFQDTTYYGGVKQHFCKNCEQTGLWELRRDAQFITLFFIPVIPQTSRYVYSCPVCAEGTLLNKKTFLQYKAIIKINLAYEKGKTTSEKRQLALEEIDKLLETHREAELKNFERESERFNATVDSKQDRELLHILKVGTIEYHPAFILAVQREATRRNLSTIDQLE